MIIDLMAQEIVDKVGRGLRVIKHHHTDPGYDGVLIKADLQVVASLHGVGIARYTDDYVGLERTIRFDVYDPSFCPHQLVELLASALTRHLDFVYGEGKPVARLWSSLDQPK